MMERKSLIFLGLVVILAVVLRFSHLTYNPPSLNWDEISYGYNAYSVMKTGLDQWGQRLPLTNFRAYGDYPTTLNLYLTIPFIAIFGLTEFAVRFPHAILGTLTIISVYFLTLGVTKRNNISLLAAFLAATGPWYVFTSRFAIQSNLSVFFLITSAALFVNRERSKYFLAGSFFALILTLFSYHTTRIFAPLLFASAVIIYRKEMLKKFLYIGGVLFIGLSAAILLMPQSRMRASVLSIINQGAVNKIIENRNLSKLPDSVNRLIYNRPVYFIQKFVDNYVNYFSPKFLFLEGGTQYQFSVPGRGLIFPVNLPFFYLGLILLLGLSLKNINHRLLLAWIILSPIPAAITNESYAVIRATTMLPIPEILIAIGLFSILDLKIKNSLKIGNWKLEINFRWLLPIYLIILLLSSETYFTNYFTKYRENFSWSWQYGYKEAVLYAKDRYSQYDKIIVTKKYGEPHEYFLFYWPWDPKEYLSDANKIAFPQSDWWWVDRFDKFYFMNDWQVRDMRLESGDRVDCTKTKCLMITSPGNYPNGWKKLETINFLNGGAAFEIYEN